MSLFYQPIKKILTEYLCVPFSLPSDAADAIYVLGGSSMSTYNHLVRASYLYKSNKAEKIILFSKPSKSVYSPSLKRNLTENEWALEKLKTMGVSDSVVILFEVSEGFFGTMSEAEALSHYFVEQNYKSVILLSSPCHSRRVENSFRYYMKSSPIKIYIQGSKDRFYMRELIWETLKVQIYKLKFVLNDLKTILL